MRTRPNQNPQQPAPIPRRNRIVGAAAAPVICEAAAVPLHWIYDREQLNRALAACPGDDPAFGPPACPYYRVGPGENGCYGDQAMATLRFLAAQNSRDFDAAGFGRFLAEAFGPGSRYGNTSARATDLYHADRPVDARLRGRERTTGHAEWPVDGPWLHAGLRTFLHNYRQNTSCPTGDPSDDQADGAVKAGAMAARYADQPPEFLEIQVDAAVRVTQDNALASAAARFLALVCHRQISEARPRLADSVIRTCEIFEHDSSGRLPRPGRRKTAEKSVARAVRAALAQLSAPDAAASEDGHARVVSELGDDCHEPGNTAAALHGALEAENSRQRGQIPAPDGILPWAVRRDIRAGGCNCSRVAQIAALLGATHGNHTLPPQWCRKARNGNDALALASRLTG